MQHLTTLLCARRTPTVKPDFFVVSFPGVPVACEVPTNASAGARGPSSSCTTDASRRISPRCLKSSVWTFIETTGHRQRKQHNLRFKSFRARATATPPRASCSLDNHHLQARCLHTSHAQPKFRLYMAFLTSGPHHAPLEFHILILEP